MIGPGALLQILTGRRLEIRLLAGACGVQAHTNNEGDRDEARQLTNFAAESWTSNAAGTEWTFKIRDGVQWAGPIDRARSVHVILSL